MKCEKCSSTNINLSGVCNDTLSDAEHFLRGLADHGGQIVSTAYCTEGEISLARVEDRFYVDKDGFGYVRLPKGGCTKPPAGWRCTRKQNHDGPCAAIPID